MKRFGEPNEVAESVVWLVSDRSSFVTGTALSVDAGAMAQ
jgi:NAD(P)-dependent dehydrogenase (short-subunit alcohol dehydrogenase family)